MNKHLLIKKLRNKNLLWNYAKDSKINDEIIVEKVLKYLDVEEILSLFKIYQKDFLIKVWEKTMGTDERFKKLNFYLEKVIFDINSDSLKKETRLDKLKSFTSINEKCF